MSWNLGKVRAEAGTPAPEAESSALPAQSSTLSAKPSEGAEIANPAVRAAVVTTTASRAVGKLFSGVAEIAIVSSCEKPTKDAPNGYHVDSLDEDDLRDLENATAEGFLKKFPDANVPWWLGMVLATGNLYLGARRNRRPREVPKYEPRTLTSAPTPTNNETAPAKPDMQVVSLAMPPLRTNGT